MREIAHELYQEYGMPDTRHFCVADIKLGSMEDQFDLYKASIPLLPPNTLGQDLTYGMDIAAMREAKVVLRSGKILTPEERLENEQAILQGQEAIEKITLPCLHMVISIAARYYTPDRGMGILEFIQRGNLALVHVAANKYDYGRGNLFRTYAYHEVRRRMQYAIQRDKLIPLPSHLQKDARKIREAEREYISLHDDLPTDDKLAEMTGLSVEEIRYINGNKTSQPISFNETAKRGSEKGPDELDLLSTISDSQNIGPQEAAEQADLRRILEEAFARGGLTENEKIILKARFGFTTDGVIYELGEIGDVLTNEMTGKKGMTRQNVFTKQKRAMKKVIKALKPARKSIGDYL